MQGLLANIVGETYAAAAMWILALIALALILLLVLRLTRRLTPGTFIAGGRGRQPRLAVMDAAPVDNHRRLVLIRRDNVEHLVLIGGPSDLVVERNIPIHGAVEHAHRPPEPVIRDIQPQPIRAPAEQQKQRAAVPPRPATDTPPVETPAPGAAVPPAPKAEIASAGMVSATVFEEFKSQPTLETTSETPALAAAKQHIDALSDELNIAPDAPDRQPVREQHETSLEEEMSRLLEDISDDRK